jgi:Polyketide cyclase / dehydrase and lipid transport
MLKLLAIVLGVVVLGLAGIAAYAAATQPDTFRVTRSLEMSAPAEKIYSILSDFRRSPEWSPYEKLDPDMKRTLSGAATGKGAVYAWDGDSNAGAGRMEIAEATPAQSITLKLDFIRPFEASNTVEYKLQPKGNSTQVSWDMHGPMPFISKVMCVFVDLDKMVGKDFETGLANLKTLAEK